MNFKKVILELNKILFPIAEVVIEINKKIKAFDEKNPEFFKNLSFYFKNMPEIKSNIWKKSAEYGWFPNWVTPILFDFAVQNGKDELDKFMINHIVEDMNVIEKKIISLYPKRADIIKTAFLLHKQENFIASIPLFLSQSDGIFSQNIGAYLFTDHEKRNTKITTIVENSSDIFEHVFWTPVLEKTQFAASIGKSSKTLKDKAPNRNGILHGSRKHLDYGTKINSFKCISLLTYTAFIFDKEKNW